MSDQNAPYRRADGQPGNPSDRRPASEVPPRPGPPRPQPSAYRQRGAVAHPKTTYMGFYFWWWLGVTALFLLGSFGVFAGGAVGAGFIGLLCTGLSALYVRYLFRGGRFRMIFIIF
ncbi:hypothetical protein [Actinomadura citrea]|uniref:Uncharacterized protein n=1 Tax=Actinomadura citrea TaxID=46158 RepID=A0A7Y9KEY2_9ACTN|nr:hypothetical protein [Actinomadura citrea]NYE14916.1 hypothetical protein [Actinomadura citrea]GGU08435.1 hypothetical protein GCM10010177_79430 [Actinomadura citrea]